MHRVNESKRQFFENVFNSLFPGIKKILSFFMRDSANSVGDLGSEHLESGSVQGFLGKIKRKKAYSRVFCEKILSCAHGALKGKKYVDGVFMKIRFHHA